GEGGGTAPAHGQVRSRGADAVVLERAVEGDVTAGERGVGAEGHRIVVALRPRGGDRAAVEGRRAAAVRGEAGQALAIVADGPREGGGARGADGEGLLAVGGAADGRGEGNVRPRQHRGVGGGAEGDGVAVGLAAGGPDRAAVERRGPARVGRQGR